MHVEKLVIAADLIAGAGLLISSFRAATMRSVLRNRLAYSEDWENRYTREYGRWLVTVGILILLTMSLTGLAAIVHPESPTHATTSTRR